MVAYNEIWLSSVDIIHHDGNSCNRVDTRWFDFHGGKNIRSHDGAHAWDLITADDQALNTGLYLYMIENLDTSEIQNGKFAIMK